MGLAKERAHKELDAEALRLDSGPQEHPPGVGRQSSGGTGHRPAAPCAGGFIGRGKGSVNEEWSQWEEQGGHVANTPRAAAWEPCPICPPQRPSQMASCTLPQPLQVGRPFLQEALLDPQTPAGLQPLPAPRSSCPLWPLLSFLFPSLVFVFSLEQNLHEGRGCFPCFRPQTQDAAWHSTGAWGVCP